MRMFDGLRNLVSGMGTARDKAGQATWYQDAYDPVTLLTAYKASSLIRRAVDLPAEDACREWREWQAEAVHISAIEAEEARLGLQGKVLEARTLARIFGGSAIMIGTGDINPALPVNPLAVKRGGLKYLTVLSRDQLSASEVDTDPLSPGYGQPKFWSLNGVRIHPTRLALFHGIKPMTGNYLDRGDGWGDSILPGMLAALTRVDEAAGNVMSLLYEAKIDVFKIPDLMNNLASRGPEYEAALRERLTLAAIAKGNSGALIMDANELYEQKNGSFGGLDAIIDRTMQLASAACGIPMTLFFGMSAGGLNASGDIDVRGYYDRVKVQQSLHMGPSMAVLDDCLIRSALGDHPDDLHYNWRPLWQPTAKERAENGKLLMESLNTLHGMDVVPTEALGKAAVNGLTECGAFPGLEGYVSEFFEANPEGEEDGTAPVDPEADPEGE